MSDQETTIKYRCPHCKLVGSDSQEVIHFGSRRDKHRGGRYTEYKTGMCKDCGTLYCYEQIETSIFARKNNSRRKDD